MRATFNRLKNYFNTTDIYTSQRLMLWLMYFAGYLPLRITEERNGRRLRASAFGYILAIIFMIFNFICLLTLCSNLRLQSLAILFERPPVADYAAFVKIISILITVPLLYIVCLRMAKKMATCMQHIVNIDRKLNIIGIDMDYWKGFKFSIFVIGFIIAYLVFVLGMQTLQNSVLAVRAKTLQQDEKKKDHIRDVDLSLWMMCVTHNLSLVAMMTVKCYYAGMARAIRERYKGINRMLRCMIEPASEQTTESFESTSWNIRNSSQICNLVSDLCSIHSDLCDTCIIVSDYFSLQMVSVLATDFITIAVNGFYFALFHVGVLLGREDKMVELIYTSIESGCVTFTIILAFNSVQSIIEENEECSANVHKILNSVTAPDAKNRLLEFSLQLIHRKVEFTGSGLFVINRALLLGIAEVITTYFLLLLEFQSNTDQ